MPGQVSAAIGRLERELGIRLFARSTRSLRLTAEGEAYLPYAREVLETLREGRERLQGESPELRGVLQVAAPSDLGRNLLLPWLAEFRQRHPGLTLRLYVSDRRPTSIAIRWTSPSATAAVRMTVWWPCRSPRTTAGCWRRRRPIWPARGRPRSLDDLSRHACLLYQLHGRTYDKWSFPQADGGLRQVAVSGPLQSDDAEVVRRWAVAGEGIVYKSWLDMRDDLQRGRLVRLLPEQPGEPLPLQLFCPHRRQFSPAVRQLHGWLAERFAALGKQP